MSDLAVPNRSMFVFIQTDEVELVSCGMSPPQERCGDLIYVLVAVGNESAHKSAITARPSIALQSPGNYNRLL